MINCVKALCEQDLVAAQLFSSINGAPLYIKSGFLPYDSNWQGKDLFNHSLRAARGEALLRQKNEMTGTGGDMYYLPQSMMAEECRKLERAQLPGFSGESDDSEAELLALAEQEDSSPLESSTWGGQTDTQGESLQPEDESTNSTGQDVSQQSGERVVWNPGEGKSLDPNDWVASAEPRKMTRNVW